MADKTDLDKNFNTIMNLFSSKYRHEELIEMLNSSDTSIIQFAVLALDEIKSFSEAGKVVENLTGQDGKIREAVAFKINYFCKDKNFVEYFSDEKFFKTYLNGIMDIDGNVCRMIVEIISFVNGFKKFLSKNLKEKIEEQLEFISQLGKNEKQYKISKRNFQLYWLMESLYEILDECDIKSFNEIIKKCSNFEDYTIREKSAKMLSKLEDFEELKNKLKSDENYYVRRLV